MNRFACSFVLSLFFANCLSANELFEGTTPKPFQIAQPLPKNSTIGGYPVWDGEGAWRMVHASTYTSTGSLNSIKIGRINLIQTEDKKLVSAMEVRGNVSGGGNNNWSDEPCKRNDLLFKANLGRLFEDVNCVTISHMTGYYASPTGIYADIYALMNNQGVDIPPTVIKVSFTRYASGGRWLTTDIVINPEIAGFARDNETWGRSSWHRSQALADPAKKQYIEQLSRWAVSFAKQIDVAFEKQRGAFDAMPSWRTTTLSKLPSQTTLALD